MTDSKIKVLTINTWKCDGEYFARIKIMAEQFSEIQPDIIVCQECFMIEDSDVNTLDFIARQLSMNKILTSARSKKRKFNNSEVTSISGLGVLSVFPLTLISEMELPLLPEDGERKIQIVTVDTPNRKIKIINVHLTHLPDSDLRMKQIVVLADAIVQQNPEETILICGDFNAEINSQEIDLLKRLTRAEDAFALGGGKYPRAASENNFQIKKAIDHIFIVPGIHGFPQFSESKVALTRADDMSGIYPSDHPGVVTTLHNCV